MKNFKILRSADRSDQLRTGGHSARAHPLSYLLGQLARAAQHGYPDQVHPTATLEAQSGAYLFEAANVRHEHEWTVWQDVKPPEGTVLIPGVVTHATNLIEHAELVAQRIVRLAKLVGRENLLAGTDCGFSQGPFSAKVHPSIQWAKLTALVEGAKLASGELWA